MYTTATTSLTTTNDNDDDDDIIIIIIIIRSNISLIEDNIFNYTRSICLIQNLLIKPGSNKRN